MFKERLGGPKDLAAQAGYYDGRALTIGFFIDHRQTIITHDNEVDNPQWKKLNNYPPHQAVIEEIYDLLVANGWDIPKTYRQIRQRPVLFPDFESWVGEASAKKVFLSKVPGGYQMSYKAFLHMLCNVTLIGYWPYRGTIRKHNHPAVIDEQRFWIGFYLVSDVTPEGELIERESRKRYTKERTQQMKASKESVQRLVRTQSQIPDINLSWEDVQVIEQYNLSPSLIVSSDIHVIWCRSAPTRARPSWTA